MVTDTAVLMLVAGFVWLAYQMWDAARSFMDWQRSRPPAI